MARWFIQWVIGDPYQYVTKVQLLLECETKSTVQYPAARGLKCRGRAEVAFASMKSGLFIIKFMLMYSCEMLPMLNKNKHREMFAYHHRPCTRRSRSRWTSFVVTGLIKTSWHPTLAPQQSRRSYRSRRPTLWCKVTKWGGCGGEDLT